MSSLVSTSTPGSFFAKLLSSWTTPSTYKCLWLFLPSCRTLHLPLWNIMRFLWAHFFRLLRSLWMTAQPPGLSAIPPRFALPVNLLRVHSETINEGVEQEWSQYWPLGCTASYWPPTRCCPTTFWACPFSQFPVHFTVDWSELKKSEHFMESFAMSVLEMEGFWENPPLQTAHSNIKNALPLGGRANAEQRLLLGYGKWLPLQWVEFSKGITSDSKLQESSGQFEFPG